MDQEFAAARMYEFEQLAREAQLRRIALDEAAKARPAKARPLSAATLVRPRAAMNPFDVAQANRIA